MSCFFLVFPSVWIYTVSPGVLLCSLAERMNGLPPLYLSFGFLKAVAVTGLLQMALALGFLSHPAFSPGQTGRGDRNGHLPAVSEGVSGFAVTP